MEQLVYPDFATWRRDAIRTASGLMLAPEDLYVCNENGYKKTYFMHREAVELEGVVLRPAGLHLMTAIEGQRLISEFDAGDKLVEELGFGYHGQMSYEAMQSSRQPDQSSVLWRGCLGYYWLRDDYSNESAMILYFHNNGTKPGVFNMPKRNGQSVRCVFDE